MSRAIDQPSRRVTPPPSEPRRRPWLATLLCLLGVGVVGAGVAWAIYEIGQPRQSAQQAEMVQNDGTPVSRPMRGVAITPGREVVGSISSISDGGIGVLSRPGGDSTELRTTPDTQVTTTHGSSLKDLSVGDVVIVEVSADGSTALAIFSGQISVASADSAGQ
ncbi:hypothetical protein [Tsukamurella soli]|uniref:DUF5666 domain-containing protein n=1 Tax=Tsukamurella soli TaxID=644556 RepID=A0ABP8JYW9_9ACTN